MCVVVDIEKVSQVGIDNDVIDFVFGALHKIAILCDYSYIAVISKTRLKIPLGLLTQSRQEFLLGVIFYF